MGEDRARETLTPEQNVPSFNPPLRAFDEVSFFFPFSYPLLSPSLIKRAITCPGQSHIKQTLALSPEPDWPNYIVSRCLSQKHTYTHFRLALCCPPLSSCLLLLLFFIVLIVSSDFAPLYMSL